MFDTSFAQLFRAVERIREQLETADPEMRQYLAEELACLERIGEQYIDRWMILDERIQEIKQTYELDTDTRSPGAVPVLVSTAAGTAASHPALPVAAVGAVQIDDIPSEWQELLFAAPEPIVVTFRKGMGYYDLAMYDDAARAFEQVVAETSSPVARVYLAAAHAARGRERPVLAHLAALRARTRDSVLLCAADEIEASLHVLHGRFEEAARCLTAAARRMPDYQDVWFNLGVCYAQLGNLPAAEHALREALRLEPDDGDAAALLAGVHLQRGEAAAALALCRDVLQDHPRHLGLRLIMSRALSALGHHDRATAVCRRILITHPDCEQAWHQLVQLLLRTGRTDEAAVVLKKRLSLDPHHAPSWLQLGIVELIRGELDAAVRAVETAAQLQADPAVVALACGQIAALRGDYAAAYPRYLEALRDGRRSVKRLSLYLYGQALMAEGRIEEAERYLKAAWVLGPSNAAVAIALARALDGLGRSYEAQQWFTKAAHIHG